MGRELNDASQVIGIMVLTIIFDLLMDRFFRNYRATYSHPLGA